MKPVSRKSAPATLLKKAASARKAGRPPLDHDPALRAKFVAAAKSLIAERGFAQTSTRQIAQAAGGNVGLIAYYFGSKEGLFRAILQDHVEKVNAGFPVALRGEDFRLDFDTYRQVLRGIVSLNFAALQSDPELTLIAQREVLDGAPRGLVVIEGLLQEMLDRLIIFVQEGKRLGYVKPELHEATFIMLLGRCVDGYYFLHRQLKGRARVADQILDPDLDTEAVIDQIDLAFFQGILQRPPR